MTRPINCSCVFPQTCGCSMADQGIRAKKADVIWRENLQEAWAALQMIRETIETLGGVGVLPSEDAVLGLHGPLPGHEAGVLVEAIKATFARAEKAEAQNAKLREALRDAACWFEEDAYTHSLRETSDGDAKATINEARARVLRAALDECKETGDDALQTGAEERLRDALEQALDDMGDAGLCVCQDTKDMMRAALTETEGNSDNDKR